LTKSKEILEHFWGYNKFRPLQEDIIDSAVYGHDTLALLPTGGGKSICFQVPGIAREGLTLVISPLIALMQDQVKNLRSRGINAQAIFSGMTYREIDILLDNAIYGNIDFLYVSPERLKTRIFIERLKKMSLGLLVVDEAHCISEWGHDFRPSYLDIHLVREFHPNTPIIALTATATQRVQEDIIEQLKLKNAKLFQGSFKRPNLEFKLVQTEDKLGRIVDFCSKHKQETGIVYCQTRKSVKEVARILDSYGVNVGIYHGGMNQSDRNTMLQAWMKNEIRVIVATNAFGMGIDKADVRYVLHYEIPNNLEAYYQEAGRAGRDEKPAIAIGFWNLKDCSKMEEQLKMQFPPISEIKTVYRALASHLQIAIGSGLDETHHFDIKKFSSQFDIPAQKIYHALRILEMNEDIQFSESVFHPTKVKFAIGNKELYNFQIKNDRFAPLISLISRSYPGIFQLFFELDEVQFTKRLNISSLEFEKQLHELEKFGILDVSWKSSLPTVTFLHERLPDDYIAIKVEIYDRRKKLAASRTKAVIDYLQEPQCRNIGLLHYFGQPAEKCGNCDICLIENDLRSPQEKRKILLVELREPQTFKNLIEKLNFSENELKKYLQEFLLNEIVFFENGHYISKK
jgi:ATP-dependent DNA helicase RecQ